MIYLGNFVIFGVLRKFSIRCIILNESSFFIHS